MRMEYIRKLIRLVEESEIGELEISRWGTRIRIRKSVAPAPAPGNPGPEPAVSVTVAAPSTMPEAVPAAAAVAPVPAEEDRYVTVRSPMVGTFYRSPAPEAPPYAEVGSKVVVGQTLCIIEAMKLMNELQAEVAGLLRKIFVENGEPVEYGQPLFLIEP